MDDKCGMRYWFNRLEGGGGLVPKAESLALRIGKETHEDLACIAEMEDITVEGISRVVNGILENISNEDKQFHYEMELLYRRLGWLSAWALFLEPKIRESYHDVGIEKELILEEGDLWVPTTPDRILRSKLNHQLIYNEFKTTITANFKWQQSWRYAIQLHIGMKAVEQELGQKVAFGRVIGLMKGSYRDGRMIHPYVWAYYNHVRDNWSHEYQRGADWIPRPIWEYPYGIVNWVLSLGEEVAREQFPHSAPVFLDERMLADWIRRRTRRQKEIKIVKERAAIDLPYRALHFERRTSQCRPAFGDDCPYLLPCWNATAEKNPMGTGEYVKREPHHDVETTMEEG